MPKTFTLAYRGLALGTRRNCIAVAINVRAEDLADAEGEVSRMAERRWVELGELIQHCYTPAHGGMAHLLVIDNHAVVGCTPGGENYIEPETAGGMPIVLRYWDFDGTFKDEERRGESTNWTNPH